MKNKFSVRLVCLIVSAILINSCSGIPNSTKGASFEITKEDRDIDDSRAEKLNEYIIGSGDIVKIFVYRHPELTQKIMISPSGKITYPFIGDLQAGGLTIFQLRDKIKSELAKGYIPNPQVSVNIESISGKKVYVLGEVAAPKVLYIKDEMDTIEAISQAGGFTRDANQSGVLLIRQLGNNRRRMDVLDLESFLKASDLRQNPKLQRGDILYVPPSLIANVDRFFRHLSTILSPIAPNLMEGIILAPRVKDTLEGKRERIFID